MIGQVREWLPREALADRSVQDAVEDAVARWSTRWFTGVPARVAGMRYAPADSRADNDDGGWRLHRRAVAVRSSRAALTRLVERALDVGTSIPDRTPADEYVLAQFERTILSDLTTEIEQTFELRGEARSEPEKTSDPFAGEGGLLVPVTESSGRDILMLAVPTGLAVRKIKATLGPSRGVLEPLQPLNAPLATVNVAVEAMVGQVELTLPELSDLAVGDVLVLDRTLDQAVDIAAAGSGQIFARALLTNVDDGIALAFDVENR